MCARPQWHFAFGKMQRCVADLFWKRPQQAHADDIPIIDAHIHLFDTDRPGGVPWPDKNNAVLYMPAQPVRYREVAVPLGVRGAIEIEASPLLEDNQWLRRENGQKQECFRHCSIFLSLL